MIWGGIALVMKRIEHAPHSDPTRVVLKSLNPKYDSHEGSPEEIRIVGRAVWLARKLVAWCRQDLSTGGTRKDRPSLAR